MLLSSRKRDLFENDNQNNNQQVVKKQKVVVPKDVCFKTTNRDYLSYVRALDNPIQDIVLLNRRRTFICSVSTTIEQLLLLTADGNDNNDGDNNAIINKASSIRNIFEDIYYTTSVGRDILHIMNRMQYSETVLLHAFFLLFHTKFHIDDIPYVMYDNSTEYPSVPFPITHSNIHRLMFAALLIAGKLEEDVYDNSCESLFYAQITGISSVQELSKLERVFFSDIVHYNVLVSSDNLNSFYSAWRQTLQPKYQQRLPELFSEIYHLPVQSQSQSQSQSQTQTQSYSFSNPPPPFLFSPNYLASFQAEVSTPVLHSMISIIYNNNNIDKDDGSERLPTFTRHQSLLCAY